VQLCFVLCLRDGQNKCYLFQFPAYKSSQKDFNSDNTSSFMELWLPHVWSSNCLLENCPFFVIIAIAAQLKTLWNGLASLFQLSILRYPNLGGGWDIFLSFLTKIQTPEKYLHLR